MWICHENIDILSVFKFVLILKAILSATKLNFVPFKFIDEKLRYGHFTEGVIISLGFGSRSDNISIFSW